MATRKIMYGLFLLLATACSQKKDSIAYPALPGYDLTSPVIIHLKSDLDEISGIQYYPKDTSVFAVNDELGVLYKIYIRKQVKVQKWKFSGEGDYEDLVLFDSTFFALQSNGNLKTFRFASKKSVVVDDCTVPLMGNNEFETLYLDPAEQKVVLICKNCAADDKSKISAFGFNPLDQSFDNHPYYTIDADAIADELGGDNSRFEPSAAAVNPVSNDLYILSSKNKAIVIARRDGKVKEAYELDPRIFKQPEGITFTPAGDMLISNESADVGSPNILIFKYKRSVHEKG